VGGADETDVAGSGTYGSRVMTSKRGATTFPLLSATSATSLRVRLRLWAVQEARRDYNEDYDYTPEQRARNEK